MTTRSSVGVLVPAGKWCRQVNLPRRSVSARSTVPDSGDVLERGLEFLRTLRQIGPSDSRMSFLPSRR